MNTIIKNTLKAVAGLAGTAAIYTTLPFVLAPVLESTLGSAPADAWRASIVAAAACTVMLWIVLFSKK